MAHSSVDLKKCRAPDSHPTWQLDGSPWRGLPLPLEKATIEENHQNYTVLTVPRRLTGMLNTWTKGLRCDGWTLVHSGREGDREIAWLRRADDLVVIGTHKDAKVLRLSAERWRGTERGEMKPGLEDAAAIAPAPDEIWRAVRDDYNSSLVVVATTHATDDAAKVTQRWTRLLVKRGWVAQPRHGSVVLTRKGARLAITAHVAIGTTTLNIATEAAAPPAFWKTVGVTMRGALTSVYPVSPAKSLHHEVFFSSGCRSHYSLGASPDDAAALEASHRARLVKAGWRKQSLRINRGKDVIFRWVYTRSGALMSVKAVREFCLETSYVVHESAPLHPRWAKGPAARLIAHGVVHESSADRLIVRFDIQALGGDPFTYENNNEAPVIAALLTRWQTAFKADQKVSSDNISADQTDTWVAVEVVSD